MTKEELRKKFCNQSMHIENNLWELKLWNKNYAFIGQNSNTSTSEKSAHTLIIHENSDFTSNILIEKKEKNGRESIIEIKGIHGGFYLFSQSGDEKGQSVKLINHNLILSLGDTFLSINLNTNEFNWLLQPDHIEVYEFYDLEDDFIVRGEMAVHRIDKNGIKQWSFSGQDIWVNMEGEREVEILNDKIILTDFNSSKYIIDLEGKQLEFIPFRSPQAKLKKKWWQI